MEPGYATHLEPPGATSTPAALAALVQWTLETHGWKLLGALLLLVVARKQYRVFAARRHHERTLAAANDPARVAVLQRETARIRRQQQEHLRAAASTGTGTGTGATRPKKVL